MFNKPLNCETYGNILQGQTAKAFHFFFIEDSYRSDSNRPKKTRKKKPIDRLDEKLTVNIIYLVEQMIKLW